MRFWREITADRYSGGAVCVLLILMFVAQIALAGRAAAAMVAPDPLSVICTSAPEGFHRPASPDRNEECPGAQLCGAGLSLPTTPALSSDVGIPIRFADRIEVTADHSAVIPCGPVVRQNHARGPPPASTAS